MSKEKKNRVVPKLRFPEFREVGEWNPHKLGELFTERQETGFPELPLLSLTEKDGIIPQEDTNRKNNSSSDKSRYLRICPGDVAYNTMRMWEGRSAFVDKEGLVSPAYTVCKPNDDVDGLFFSYYFKTQQLIKQFHRYSQGLVKDTLNLKFAGFSLVEVLSPKKPEQQKIAACLTTLDELITAQGEKIKALQAHKKGLMQRLFPAEGETVPRVRFGEFEGEWEEKTLGEVGDVITGNTPSTSEPENYGGKRMFVSPADIAEFRYVTQTKTTLSEIGYSKTRHIKANSVLFVCIGSTIGKVAQNKFDCATNQQLNSIVPYESYLSDFIYSLLERESTRIATLAGIQAVPIINKSLFSSVSLNFPPSYKEQQKIAACLTTLDDLLAAQSEKLEALKRQKKGLMQQLFPSPEGASSATDGA